jgi:uncharacterized membrane-anchored protein YjiN (DUF445 family)
MPQAPWLEALITVGFGALAGGVTNAIAVWMLFHPYERRGLGPLAIHGAIPKNKARLARAIGKTVGQRLLSQEDLARQLTSPVLRDAFDRALATVLDRVLNTPRGSLRAELPAALIAELERALEPLAERLADGLAAFVEGPGFDAAVDRYVALEQWVSEGVARPELEHAIREFIAGVRVRALRDEDPLLDRLPSDLIAAVQQAIADYLPIAVERLGAMLADPVARDRIRGALKRALDRALREMMLHERVVARLVITERRIDKALASLEGGGLAELVEVFESAEFRSQVARAVNDAVVRFLRTPLAQRLWALGPDRLDGVERAASAFIIRALRAPETRAWAVARARQAIALGRAALTGGRGREWVKDAAHAAVRALLDRPLGRPADYLPPDAEARLRHTLADPLWTWMQGQVPAVVAQLSVQEMVEEKVLGLPIERVEEIIKGVTERELQLIVRLGYLLGGIVGAGAVGLRMLFR